MFVISDAGSRFIRAGLVMIGINISSMNLLDFSYRLIIGHTPGGSTAKVTRKELFVQDDTDSIHFF